MHWWYFLVAIVGIIGIILLLAAMRPPDFSISRSIQMNAVPAKPFALVSPK